MLNDEQRDGYQRDGYLVIPGFKSAAEIAALRERASSAAPICRCVKTRV
jgi:phytanoyl-CoA hydroxylase